MARSYANLLYHIVFAAKDRRPLIAPEIAARRTRTANRTPELLCGGTRIAKRGVMRGGGAAALIRRV
jgi:hypothetical protein